MRGGYAHEVSGELRAVVAHPLRRVEALGLAMVLCLVAGWEGRSATTLFVSTGVWPERLPWPSGSGQGGSQAKRHGSWYRLYPLPTIFIYY